MKISIRHKLILAFIFLALVYFPASLRAQDDYQKWLRQHNEKFQDFKDKRDKAFSDFLQQEWKKMQMMQGLVPDEKPKPVNIPVAKPEDYPENVPPKTPKIVKDIELPKPEPQLPPKPEIELPKVQNQQKITTAFFGTPITFAFDKNIFFDAGNDISSEAIADFWAKLGKSDYEPVLQQVTDLRKELNLNDWGTALLLDQVGSKIYRGNRNQAILFTWFMLAKFGYNVKVGFYNNEVALLMPARQTLFEVMYFVINEKRYYAVSFSGKPRKLDQLYTYDGNYPGADKLFDMTMDSSPQIGNLSAAGLGQTGSLPQEGKRNLRFNWNGQKLNLTVEFNRNIIAFLNDYPHTDLDIYFNSTPSRDAAYSLLAGLKPYITEKPETAAINMILRFVQTAFEYKTDAEQFGQEKYLFSEETIFYPYSDCEDRSILFAFLVRRLLGLEIIGLDYPGHIATAVKLNSQINGDYVNYDGEKYTICDPTYINANAGMCMPQFKNVKPKIIIINKLAD